MTKRETVISEWNRLIEKAEKRLADSTKCFELFGEESDKIHMDEDKNNLSDLKSQFSSVIAYMDAHGVE